MQIGGPRLSFGTRDLKGNDPWSQTNRRAQTPEKGKESDVLSDAFDKARRKGKAAEPSPEKAAPKSPFPTNGKFRW